MVQKPTPRGLVLTADKPRENNTSGYFTIFKNNNIYIIYYN